MRFVIALALGLTHLPGQTPEFDTQSRLVVVPVTVTDSRGRAMDNLEPVDFELLDEGRPQTLSVDTFATGVAPVALVVAVQCSGISTPALAKIRRIGGMIQPLITGERGSVAVVAFDDQVQWLQEFTRDPYAIDRSFARLQPGEEKKARMLDAVSSAVKRLGELRDVRRVLLVVSETRDRGSETALEDVVLQAQRAGVAIYSATYSATATAFTAKPEDTHRSRQGLDIIGGVSELVRLGKTKTTAELTAATGGAAFSFARQKALENAIEKLGSELSTQYLLSFTPEPSKPGYRRIDVRVRGRADLRVRARPGYWSTQATTRLVPAEESPRSLSQFPHGPLNSSSK